MIDTCSVPAPRVERKVITFPTRALAPGRWRLVLEGGGGDLWPPAPQLTVAADANPAAVAAQIRRRLLRLAQIPSFLEWLAETAVRQGEGRR